ncbi:MAG: CvpA family protein [Patescibacteria group bacterium]
MYSLGINLIDVGVMLIVLFFIRDGFRKGFFALALEMSSFLLGVVVALLFYNQLGGLAAEIFGMSRPFAKVLAFLLLWLMIEAVVPALSAHLYLRVPALWLQSKWNHRCGILPAMLEATLLCVFLLSLAISFPFPPLLKQKIFASYVGEPMVRSAQVIESFMAGVFGESNKETLAFMTTGRIENELIELGFSTDEIFPDPGIERRMFDLVNAARTEAGLKPLVMDQSLVEVARLHGSDMFRRGYLGHVSPEGHNVSDRATEANVTFERIGENLAYAPDVSMAHTGLMNSERHRTNILSGQFSRIGIGVQNAGANGMLYVQVFAD